MASVCNSTGLSVVTMKAAETVFSPAFAPLAAAGQAPPLSSEFQVNTYTMFNQEFPSVASSGNGGFVVAGRARFRATGSSASVTTVWARESGRSFRSARIQLESVVPLVTAAHGGNSSSSGGLR